MTADELRLGFRSGPAPVPLAQYVNAVRAQRLENGWLTRQALADAFRHMVIGPDVLTRVGPAVNSGKSFLIYGQPGNGKTALAEAFLHIDTEPIYMPYAIECQGNIVQLYDPIYHKKIEAAPQSITALDNATTFDGRWFAPVST